MNKTRPRGSLAALLTLCLLLQPALLAATAEDSAGGLSTILGQVLGRDGKTPAVGAVVHVYHLSSEGTFSSAPVASNGKFEVSGLPYGYFDIAVETSAGLFVADQVANVAPSTKVVLTLSLADFAPGSEADERRVFPGSDATSVGVARVVQKAGSGSFWKSRAGLGVMIGGGGAALLAIASGGGGNNQVTTTPVSPASPGN